MSQFAGQDQYGQTTQTQTTSPGTAGWLSSLIGGVSDIGVSYFGGDPRNSQSGQPIIIQQEKSNNTIYMVIGGVLLLVVLFFVFKKK